MTNSRIRPNEPGVEKVFQDKVDLIAKSKNWQYKNYPLGGADYEYADQLIAADFRYALIEFKFTEKQMPEEGKKDHRHVLCVALKNSEEIAGPHNVSHFAGWLDIAKKDCFVNIYRNAVCHRGIFKNSEVIEETGPDISTQLSLSEFVETLFAEQSTALEIEPFQEYLDWLDAVRCAEDDDGGGSGNPEERTFTILALNPINGDILTFTGDALSHLDTFRKMIYAALNPPSNSTPSFKI